MKVKLKKDINLIKIIPSDIFLKQITSDGYYEYEITYSIHAKKAMINKVNLVKILASKNPIRAEKVKIFDSELLEEIPLNIQLNKSLNKDINKSKTSDIFFEFLSDITKRIPNDKTQILANKALDPNTIIATKKVLTLMSVESITQKNVVVPVLETNTVSFDSNTSNVNLKEISKNLLIGAIDPASIMGAKTDNFHSARRVSGGLINKKNKKPFCLFSDKIKKYKNYYNINYINDFNPSVQTQLSEGSIVNVQTEEQVSEIKITETIYLPYDELINNDFYLTLKAINNLNLEVQSVEINVPHSKLVSQLQIPSIPPEVKLLSTGVPGKNTILIKQLDKTAKGVAVYKKEIKSTTSLEETNYHLVGKLDTVYGDDYQRFFDISSNCNSTIYRCIPYNNENILCGEFTSVGIKGNQKLFKKYKAEHVIENAVITYNITEPGIEIELRNISESIITYQVLRRTLTNYEKDYSVIHSEYINSSNGNSIYTYLDSDVVANKTYEYKVQLMLKAGKQLDIKNNLIIQYNPTTNNIVDTVVTTPKVVQNEQGIDVTFDITSNFITTNNDKIKQFLEEQGLLNFYYNEISNEKEKLQNLVVYEVERINLSTGEVESFGIVNSTSFSDIEQGKIKNVKPLDDGKEYKYKITTYFRLTETLFKTYSRTITDINNRTYTLYPYKWRHPLILDSGNITSDNSLKRNHSSNELTMGKITSIIYTDVSLANILPSIKEAQAVKTSNNSILLQWRVQGNVKKIDHFIIILEILGIKSVIGKCHNISNLNYFQYVDNLDNNEHGKLKYYITPVLYDYTNLTSAETNEVII